NPSGNTNAIEGERSNSTFERGNALTVPLREESETVWGQECTQRPWIAAVSPEQLWNSTVSNTSVNPPLSSDDDVGRNSWTRQDEKASHNLRDQQQESSLTHGHSLASD
ncbi:8518_t:CDS:2, partial [Scutellospora calospora]